MKKYLTLAAVVALIATLAVAQTTVVNIPADPFTGNNIKARAGQTPGVDIDTAIGHCDALPATLTTLYHGANIGELDFDTLITTPATVGVASTDVDDDADGTATGALIVRLSGLNNNLVEITDDVTLDGQTPVTSAKPFYVVTGMQVISAGSTGSNEGTLWVGAVGSFTAGVPSTKFNAMEAGTNVAATGVKAVPAGKRLFITQLSLASGDTSKILNFQFRQYSAATGLWYESYDIHGKQDFLVQNVLAYPSLGPGDLVVIRCKVDVGSAIVTGSLAGIFIDTL